jgi:hypothetical protein
MDSDTGTGRWMTYDELAEARGMKRSGAVRLVQRKKWRRQAGNDGLARILVPATELPAVPHTSTGTRRPERGGDAGAGTIAAAITALEAAVTTLTDQLSKAEARAEALARAGENHAAEVGSLRGRLDQAQAEARAAKERAERLEQEQRGWWHQGRLRRAWDGWRGR